MQHNEIVTEIAKANEPIYMRIESNSPGPSASIGPRLSEPQRSRIETRICSSRTPHSDWAQISPFTSPSARYSHAMAYDGVRKKVIMFGGWNGGYLGDMWAWDGTNWANISPPQNNPSARYAHTMAYDAARQQVVLFGGYR